jgi:hypothetical protein
MKFDRSESGYVSDPSKDEHPFGRFRVADLGIVFLALGVGICLGNDTAEEPLTDHSDYC